MSIYGRFPNFETLVEVVVMDLEALAAVSIADDSISISVSSGDTVAFNLFEKALVDWVAFLLLFL